MRGSDGALESVTPVKTFLAFAVGEKIGSFKPYDFSLIGVAFLWHQMETCQIRRKKKNLPLRADKEKPAADSEAPGTEIAGFDVGSSEGHILSRLIARRRHSQREKSISPATICRAAMQNSYRMFSPSERKVQSSSDRYLFKYFEAHLVFLSISESLVTLPSLGDVFPMEPQPRPTVLCYLRLPKLCQGGVWSLESIKTLTGRYRGGGQSY